MGNKNSGRQTKKEEIQAAIEVITQDALIALANSKVKKQLDKIENFKDVKEMALPITLKGIVERKDITSLGESITPIYNGLSIQGHECPAQDIPTQE